MFDKVLNAPLHLHWHIKQKVTVNMPCCVFEVPEKIIKKAQSGRKINNNIEI